MHQLTNTAMADMQRDQGLKYKEGEKILCFHGPLLYEAKCLQTRTEMESKYFIHYQGWNKSWDEWVNDARIVRYDEAGIKQQQELLKHYSENTKGGLKKRDLKNQLTPPPEAIAKLKRLRGKRIESSSGHETPAAGSSNVSSEEELNISTTSSTVAPGGPVKRGRGRPSLASMMSAAAGGEIGRKSSTPIIKSGRGRRSNKSMISTMNDVSQPEVTTLPPIQTPLTPLIPTATTPGSDTTSNLTEPVPVSRTLAKRRPTSPQSVSSTSVAAESLNSTSVISQREPVKVAYTESIKQCLMDDLNYVLKHDNFLPLPASESVAQILDLYVKWSGVQEEPIEDMKEEFAAGLETYFNLVLPCHLLYPQEKALYVDHKLIIKQKKIKPSEYFGLQHLLRLIVKLPDLVSQTKLDHHIMQFMLNDFTKFLDQHCSDMISSNDYVSLLS